MQLVEHLSKYDLKSLYNWVTWLLPSTEASKLVMSYVAAVCGKGAEVNQVKEQLLQSNPVLEGKNFLFGPRDSNSKLCFQFASTAQCWERGEATVQGRAYWDWSSSLVRLFQALKRTLLMEKELARLKHIFTIQFLFNLFWFAFKKLTVFCSWWYSDDVLSFMVMPVAGYVCCHGNQGLKKAWMLFISPKLCC